MLVICDINIYKLGHYIGFNQYLLDHADQIRRAAKTDRVVFFFNEEAKTLLSIPANVEVEFLPVPSIWRYQPMKRFRIWRIINERMQQYPGAHLYYMDFDKFQLPVGLMNMNFRLSGIYFRPHHRITTSNRTLKIRLQTWLKRYKKIAAERLLLRNRSLERVYILNDREGVSYLNKYHGNQVFRYLPDPIFDYGFEPGTIERPVDSISFLIFGALTERKNIRMLITAFGRARFSKKAVLHLVGKTESDQYLQSLRTLAADSIRGQEAEKSVLFNTDFVSDEEMERYHASTHVSLLVYRDFYGSSGLIGRAAKHRQLVIAPSVGLLSEITEQYRLGITVDPNDLTEITVAMEKAEQLVKKQEFEGATAFYKEHHPSRFLETLFSID
ncbi:MAG TPA: glycosyltransferase [Flavihumibacter sp.]|jgi:glycosyltransferase involved in cell wall biosynthesis